MVPMFQRAVRAVQTVECVIAAAILVVVVACMALGIRPFYVVSGSMEPSIPVGALALVRQGADPAGLEEGDVVAFEIQGGETVTHRVVANDAAAGQIVTKGDANGAADPSPVDYADVVGKCALAVPGLGYVLGTLASYKWTFIAVVVGGNVLLCVAAWAVEKASSEEKGTRDGRDQEVA